MSGEDEAVAKALNNHSREFLNFLGGGADNSAFADLVGDYFTSDDPEEAPDGKVLCSLLNALSYKIFYSIV